jgi:hypothetical protein
MPRRHFVFRRERLESLAAAKAANIGQFTKFCEQLLGAGRRLAIVDGRLGGMHDERKLAARGLESR